MNDHEKIKLLTALWYSLLIDHHKDRDCHFYITTDFKYSGETSYTVEHIGYIQKEYSKEFDNLGSAEKYLMSQLYRAILKEINGYLALYKDPENEYNKEEILWMNKDKCFFENKLIELNKILEQ